MTGTLIASPQVETANPETKPARPSLVFPDDPWVVVPDQRGGVRE